MFEKQCEELNKINSFPKSKKTYTVKEIIDILDICKDTAYTIISAQKFKSFKFKRQIRIDKESFDQWYISQKSKEV